MGRSICVGSSIRGHSILVDVESQPFGIGEDCGGFVDPLKVPTLTKKATSSLTDKEGYKFSHMVKEDYTNEAIHINVPRITQG
jgi:hypothetical protein